MHQQSVQNQQQSQWLQEMLNSQVSDLHFDSCSNHLISVMNGLSVCAAGPSVPPPDETEVVLQEVAAASP